MHERPERVPLPRRRKRQPNARAKPRRKPRRVNAHVKREMIGAAPISSAAPRFMTHSLTLVLDTNVVLDWLVFHDSAMESLRDAVAQRRVLVITHLAAIDELRRVLAYPQCKLCEADQEQLLNRYCVLTHQASMPPAFALGNLLLPEGFPRCRDTDDQH